MEARQRRQFTAGFTLVEVMISVALVLFLIIGVNQVFKTTSDAVGAGQVLSKNIRDTRAAQAVFYSDLAGAAANPPMFIIEGQRVAAFRHAADMAGDKDFNPASTGITRDNQILSRDLNDDGDETDPAIGGSPFAESGSRALYDHRNHRIDRLAFFGRDIYSRQTGDDGTYVSNTPNATGSNEAWIWYGHLRLANSPPLPTTPRTYYQPGQRDASTTPPINRNDNNAFASQFALGRMVMLLRDPNSFPSSGAGAENHIARVPAIPASGTAPANPRLTPLSWDSPRTDLTSEPVATDRYAWSSRYDLAATTIAQFEQDLLTVATDPSKAYWWQWFLYATPGNGPTDVTSQIAAGTIADYRFRADRKFDKPLDSYKAAMMAPILLDGCSQFIVEFAGDYVTQDPTTGAIGPATPDGIVDFVVDPSLGPRGRTTRWYGLPRDVAGSPTGGPDGKILTASPSLDVLPVKDVRGGTPATFERAATALLPNPTPPDYAVPGVLPANARYTCVWGPDVNLTTDPLPKMLRITLVLDDATGRLAEGQQYEYVIKLPY